MTSALPWWGWLVLGMPLGGGVLITGLLVAEWYLGWKYARPALNPLDPVDRKRAAGAQASRRGAG